MRNMLGVMQGRLLPKYQGRYQAHPVGYWQQEFEVAAEIGLDCVEFILDLNNIEENPLLKSGGIDEIKQVSDQTGVIVRTICADYLMEAPLHSDSQSVAESSQQATVRLLENAAKLDVTDVVVPCVDHSTLGSQAAIDLFIEKMAPLVQIAERLEVNLSLETDLAPKPFIELLDRFQSDRVTVNYDIGNSAALGYNPVEELDFYGKKITDVHIKDRLLGGGSVVLGHGAANFEAFFVKLNEFDYKGPFIIQAYRDEEGLEIFRQQFEWIKPYLIKSVQ